MPVTKLTLQEVQKASSEGGRDTIYRDTEVKGLTLKVTPANNKIFLYQYRVGGRAGITRRITIGKFPAIKPDQARKLAIQYAAEVAQKADPYMRQKKETGEQIKSHANAFAKVFEAYDIKRLSQNRSGKEVKQIFEREFFPSLRNTAISAVDRTDISKVINQISERGAQYAANRALTHIKTFFRWAVGEGYLQGDPTSVMQRPFKGEIERERVLTADEIKLLWPQFSALKCAPFGDALKLLLLIGQRRDEVGAMRWDNLDVEKAIWSMPRSSTKNKLPHVVPLTEAALKIISKQVRLVVKDPATGKSTPSPYVFTTTGNTPISGWSRMKLNIGEALMEKKKKIEDWRFHDLRRTVSTNLGDMGYHDEDIGMLLNHQSRGVTAIYNRSTYLAKKKEMLERWEGKLFSIL